MSRKTAREVAMKLAFSRLLGGDDEYAAILEKSGIDEKPLAEDIAFANEILQGIEENKEEIDGWIAKNAIGWKIERMPKVDVCILRVAIFEMLYRDDIPLGVSINEAVELAKRFGTAQSSAYINGVLGALANGDER
jgi:N utilization substance protein B